MAYRDRPIAAEPEAADLTLPTRIAAGAAIAMVALNWAAAAIPDATWLAWFREASSIPTLLRGTYYLLQIMLAAAAGLLAARAKERDARRVAWACVAIGAVLVVAQGIDTIWPSPPRIDETLPSYAP